MARPILERLAEFYRRLALAVPARSSNEALALLCRVLEEVEDELSGIPKQVPPPDITMFDGRLYPPLPDNMRRVLDGGIIATTRKHTLMFGSDGSISIVRTATGAVEFSKLGARS